MQNQELCNVAILAGGFGTRLRSRMGTLPKPMTPILGIPVLEHQIMLCHKFGFNRIALLVHHEFKMIQEYFKGGERFGVALNYCIEDKPRGTAGALSDSLHILEDKFLVLYADTYADVNLRKLWDTHESIRPSATLLLHPNDHPYDSDLVEVDRSGTIRAIHAYPHSANYNYRNLVNAAAYVLEKKELYGMIPGDGRIDLAKNTFPEMLKRGMFLNSYITPEYIRDMGTPDRLDKVENDIKIGLPERLSDRGLRSAVFLDRDGTINYEVGHLCRPEEFELLPGAGSAIKKLNLAGLLAIGITNQPIIARGDVTFLKLNEIHAKMDRLLGEYGSYLDSLYICPHHPDGGFDGEVEELKIECQCRKPKTGMIDRAVNEFFVDRRHSWMIGDTTTDIEAGKRAGLRTILLRTGHAGLDQKYKTLPDYVATSLSDAVDLVIHGHGAIFKQLLNVCTEVVSTRLVLIGGCMRSGKTVVSTVLKEMMSEAGRNVHIISLDELLRPSVVCTSGFGVSEHNDIDAMHAMLLTLMDASTRIELVLPLYESQSRMTRNSAMYSVGPDDLIIVEGCAVLLDPVLLSYTDVRIFVDASEEVRVRRIKEDSVWRESKSIVSGICLASREPDEMALRKASMLLAKHIVLTG